MVTPQAGQIWGNYQLKHFIAKGGFGWVFAAEHKWLKSQVAIKILDTTPYRLQKDIEQFLAEAQKLQALRHPNIVEVKDFGIAYDMPYLVMPLYRTSLSSMRGQILPLPTIIAYVKQIAAALNFVHQYQIVHRDIKPENFLLGNDSEIILSDFGIAIVTHSVKSDQEYAGTAPYMPPEQWRAKAVRASDQYALAIVVYQWLCGELPFQGTTLEVMGQHINLQPPSLRMKNPTIEEDLESVVMKALAKDPTQRFQTIVGFAEALEKAAKQFNLKLLLTLPIRGGETVQLVDWVWGNHYLFVAYEKTVQIIDVLNGRPVFSADHHLLELGVFWDRANCTGSFDEKAIAFGGNRPHQNLIDTNTGKILASFPYDSWRISEGSDWHQLKVFGQSSEGRKITALANSLIKSDPGWSDFDASMQWLRAQAGFIPNSITSTSVRTTDSSGGRICYCPQQWQYIAVARVNEQQRIYQIEAYQVIGQ